MRRGTHALLYVNPSAAGVADNAPSIIDMLAEEGIETELLEVPDPAQLEALLTRRASDAELVIVGGGDGTLNAAARPIAEAGAVLGILPLGNANDLAQTLGIPRDVRAACRVIARGETRAIDLGEVNGRLFFNAAVVGLGATVARRMQPAAKRRWGRLSYLPRVVTALRETRPFALEVAFDDGPPQRFSTIHVGVLNGRRHGGGIRAPLDGTIYDGRLSFYSIRPRSWARLVLLVPRLRRGTMATSAAADAAEARVITLHTGTPMPIVADGESVDRTPAVFRVHPATLRVRVPSTGGPAAQGS